MTFARREITLQFSNAAQEVSLSGLRVEALIANPGGLNGVGQCQLRAFGLPLSVMNEFSSVGTVQRYADKTFVTVSAGDEGNPLRQVFRGSIVQSYIDLSGIPESAFVISAITAYAENTTTVAANSYDGSRDAADIIKAIAILNGFEFQNPNGARCMLRDVNVYGSPIQQMKKVAFAAAFPLIIENQTVTIWPNDGFRDGIVIELGPETGMVGYPTYWEAGFVVRSIFNPLIGNGRELKLTSGIPKANGSWPIQSTTHELSTMPGGPWFTTAALAPQPYVQQN